MLQYPQKFHFFLRIDHAKTGKHFFFGESSLKVFKSFFLKD